MVIFIFYALLGLGVVANLISTVIDYMEYKNDKFNEARNAARKRTQAAAAEQAMQASSNQPVAASAALGGARILSDEEILKGDAVHSVYDVVRASIFLAIWLFIGGFLFHHSEGWLYFDGVYFAYETLSTIGFGDQSSLYVANETSSEYLSAVKVTGKQCVEHKGVCTWGPCEVHSSSRDQQPLSSCLKEKESEVGECSCILSTAGKAIVMVYSIFSFAVLANLLARISRMIQLLIARSKGTKKGDHERGGGCREHCPCLRRWWVTFKSLVLIIVSLGYIFAGAAVFIALDSSFVDPDNPRHAWMAAACKCSPSLSIRAAL